MIWIILWVVIGIVSMFSYTIMGGDELTLKDVITGLFLGGLFGPIIILLIIIIETKEWYNNRKFKEPSFNFYDTKIILSKKIIMNLFKRK